MHTKDSLLVKTSILSNNRLMSFHSLFAKAGGLQAETKRGLLEAAEVHVLKVQAHCLAACLFWVAERFNSEM